jgi:pyruvate/2-oxoglutarate dehydrogenase complex dihydrolipoamide acyltransferase (E2) component
VRRWRPDFQPKTSVRRQIAVASWRAPRDGRIYARFAIDATPVLRYVDSARAATGQYVSVTSVVGAALGRTICDVPEVRARVVFGRIRPYETCDVGFAVDIGKGTDLAPVKVRNADQKTPAQIAQELSRGSDRLRVGKARGHSRSSAIVRHLPWWAHRPVLGVASVLVGGLGVPALGQPAFPLGAAFVTNVGTFDLDEAFTSPVPFARVPLYLTIGALREAPMAVNGQVVVRPQLVIGATADHRLIDGAHAGQVAASMRELLADPKRLDKPWPHT